LRGSAGAGLTAGTAGVSKSEEMAAAKSGEGVRRFMGLLMTDSSVAGTAAGGGTTLFTGEGETVGAGCGGGGMIGATATGGAGAGSKTAAAGGGATTAGFGGTGTEAAGGTDDTGAAGFAITGGATGGGGTALGGTDTIGATARGVAGAAGVARRSEGKRMPQKPRAGSVNSSSTYPVTLR